MALQRRISKRRNKQLIGRELPVLVEGPSQETELLWEARFPTQAPEIDGVCYLNDFGPSEEAPRRGEIRMMRVTEAHDYDLVGELVDMPERDFAPSADMTASNPFPILHAGQASKAAAIPVR